MTKRFLVDYPTPTEDEDVPEEYWVIDSHRNYEMVPDTKTDDLNAALSMAADCEYLGDDTYGA